MVLLVSLIEVTLKQIRDGDNHNAHNRQALRDVVLLLLRVARSLQP